MTKVISISDEAYEALKKLKAERSFSEIIIEVVGEKKKDLFMEAIGSWSKGTADKVKKMVYEDRKMPS
ncbi:antitoxin VapB family protein, partial [Candidatus Pacearchaeota archaeon]|nr:antitoxin VapB family protein [Candidatus Pacearchaeota archaeon]